MNKVVAEQMKFEVIRQDNERNIGKTIAVFETRELANDYVKYMQSFNNSKYSYYIW